MTVSTQLLHLRPKGEPRTYARPSNLPSPRKGLENEQLVRRATLG